MTLWKQVEAAAGSGKCFAEVTLGEQHLAQGTVGQVQLGIDT